MFAWSQLDFSATPVSISAVSLTSRQTWQNERVNSLRRLQRIQNVQEGRRHQKKETSSCFCLCSCWILNDIGRNFLSGNRKKIAKCWMRTFTCRSTFLYAVWAHLVLESWPHGAGAEHPEDCLRALAVARALPVQEKNAACAHICNGTKITKKTKLFCLHCYCLYTPSSHFSPTAKAMTRAFYQLSLSLSYLFVVGRGFA